MASKQALLDALTDLTPREYQRFCFQLKQRGFEQKLLTLKGYEGPTVYDQERIIFTDLLISTYTEFVALQVTVDILKEIGCHYEADRLVFLDNNGGLRHRGIRYCMSDFGYTHNTSMQIDEQSLTPGPSGKEHFVDKYKVQLIHRVSNIKPILDELLTKGVIQHTAYKKIRTNTTSEEKMRELLHILKAGGVGGKNIFYNILEKLEPHLIEEIVTNKLILQSDVGYSSQKALGNVWTNVKKMRATRCDVIPEDDWTTLEPEVNCVDAEVASMYSLQSEAGHFECSVSGLRWVCTEKVSFKYHFGSWEEHMERLKTMQYMPGGPLLDITVITGKLGEVYLPHWICIVDNPEILGKFAVLHIDTCGDVVEQVSEVTPSHVKLHQPMFSPRGVMMRAGFPVKINCKVLIYKTNKAFLTLHVYLIPRDPALQQTIKNKELSSGYKMIQKPYPEKSLKMRNHFILTADMDSAEIYPEKLKLIYESSDPNFFEVFVENPECNIKLTLKNESGPVWTCAIRKDDYQNTGDIQVTYEEELAKVRRRFVERVSKEVINQLLDYLLEAGVLNDGETNSILQENTTRAERARCLIDTVRRKGHTASWKMLTRLQSRDPTLYAELELPSGLPA